MVRRSLGAVPRYQTDEPAPEPGSPGSLVASLVVPAALSDSPARGCAFARSSFGGAGRVVSPIVNVPRWGGAVPPCTAIWYVVPATARNQKPAPATEAR